MSKLEQSTEVAQVLVPKADVLLLLNAWHDRLFGTIKTNEALDEMFERWEHCLFSK